MPTVSKPRQQSIQSLRDTLTFAGFRYWNNPGAFAEYLSTGSLGKFEGFLAGLWSASFCVVGPEYISMVAAEAKRPRIYIKNAFKTVNWRFGLFFIICFRKYMEYERERANGEEAPAVARTTSPDEITELSTDVLPQRAPHQHSGDAADVFTDDRRRRAREARETREPGTTSTDENRIS